MHELLILLQTESESTIDEAPLSTSEEDVFHIEDDDLNTLLDKVWASEEDGFNMDAFSMIDNDLSQSSWEKYWG